MLKLELEIKYEQMNLHNITVKSFQRLEEVTWNNYSYVCIDEINLYDVKVEELKKINAKGLWIVIRETVEENPEEYLKKCFPQWDIVHLSYPLRTPKRISEEIKRGQINNNLHQNDYNTALIVTENMPLGPKPLIFQRQEGSYREKIVLTYSYSQLVNKNTPAVIILDWSDMKPTSKEIQEAKRSTLYQKLAEKTDKQTQNYLVAIEAVKACQRFNKPPLQWFSSRYANISNTEEEIKEWMKNRNKGTVYILGK